MADYYTKEAKKIVEPKPEDILNAAKNYLVARRIMNSERCQGISLDCLGLVSVNRIPCPPCIAWSRLLDQGDVGTCEADTMAGISQLLTAKLIGQPGFMQDPVPNTVTNSFIGRTALRRRSWPVSTSRTCRSCYAITTSQAPAACLRSSGPPEKQ